MLTKDEQSQLRSDLFRHLDGIVTSPTAHVLHQSGLLDHLLTEGTCELSNLSERFKANEGYLNVGLRVLSSQGWLDQKVDNEKDLITYSANNKTATALKLMPAYKEVFQLMQLGEKYHDRKFEVEPFLALEKLFKSFTSEIAISPSENEEEEKVRQQILKHIEGVILGPTLVKLAMSGMFHKYFMQASFKAEEFHQDAENFERLLDILTYFGWFQKKERTYRFTDKGLFFARRASAYGVTVSYLPTLRKLDQLIFGDALAAKRAGDEHREGHVDRAMNVWGSGGAHAAYFKVVDEIVIELFNRPLDEQPKGILDMGCGNGAFIEHLYHVIEGRTRRGEMLDEHPLILVGADFNEAALNITKGNLIQADIWAKVVFGDIGDPKGLADQLMEDYGIALGDLLNVRTFLDHNRMWKAPEQVDKNRVSSSTGAYAYEGKRINNNLIEESMLEHFRAWKPYVERFGLLVIELHTVQSELVAVNLGKSPATAYDATHGFSDQYIVEVDVFHKILAESGLKLDQERFRKFPDNDLATVTVNLFRAD
jgi:hypothetical protein